MQSAKSALFASMPLSTVALIINISFKVFLASLIAKETLAIFFTALDFFAISLLILVGFRSSMVVSYARTKEDVKILNLFRGILLLAVLLAWAFIIPYLKHKMGVNVDYWYLVAALLSTGIWTYLGNELSMYRMYSAMNYATLLEPLFTVVWFSIAWYGFSVAGLQALFIGTVMGSLVMSSFLFYAKLKNRLKEPPIKLFLPDRDMKQFLKNSIISTIEFGSGIVMIYVAVFFLLKYHTTEDLGNFQVVVKPILMGLIAIFIFPIFRFFLPEFSKLVVAKDLKSILKLKNEHINFIAFVSVAIIVLFLLWGEELITLFFPSRYGASYLMLTHLLFFFPFIAINALQLSIIKAFGLFLEALLVRVSGVGIFILSYYIFRTFSSNTVVDVVMGLSTGYLGMFVISFFIERRVVKSKLL